MNKFQIVIPVTAPVVVTEDVEPFVTEGLVVDKAK
jgi:hypothetical protein